MRTIINALAAPLLLVPTLLAPIAPLLARQLDLSADAIVILATDLLWTAVCIVGLYYGQNEVREATKTVEWFKGKDDPRNQRLSRLHRRAAYALLEGTVVGTLLGVLVIYSDLADLFGSATLEIEPERFVYRVILIGPVMGAFVYALRILKKMRDIWGEG